MKLPWKNDTLRALLVNLALPVIITVLLAIIFFYIYLPSTTSHGETVVVPDLTGKRAAEVGEEAARYGLRYEVSDSAYQEDTPPFVVLTQVPRPGARVKAGRLIYITLNQSQAPTVPVPEIVERSLINAEAVLKSSQLRRGVIYFDPSPFRDFVIEVRYRGQRILPGTRLPKGSVIDLVVGDGRGPADFVVGSLIGDSFTRAKIKLLNWNLHLGEVLIADGVDTTGMDIFVYKQLPLPGDSVRLGDPIDLWIGPKDYKDPTGDGNAGGNDDSL
ncbi:MAG TPA: penicillin-binding protein [Cytophagales bacterium]|nr:penicillin-binding protein [Cytophagales bacterium]